MNPQRSEITRVLLRRRGLLFLPPAGGAQQPEDTVLAFSLELAALGFLPSAKLTARLRTLPDTELRAFTQAARDALMDLMGSGVTHAPLFKDFPTRVPDDTRALWWKKVVAFYLQDASLPCLTCGAEGTCHVLTPCSHIVCDECFDGSMYSACPVCEQPVDRNHPFFKPQQTDRSSTPQESPTFKRIDLGEDVDAEARVLFEQLCARKQVLSPDDVAALKAVLDTYEMRLLPWVPGEVAVRENVAHIFGTLFRRLGIAVLPIAAAHLKTATDVLRFLASASEVDVSLAASNRTARVDTLVGNRRWHGAMREQIERYIALRDTNAAYRDFQPAVSIAQKRFRVLKLGRGSRRSLLAMLERFEPDLLTEDMLRHRSAWLGVGEMLHPHEYASRYPKTARAFQTLRRKAPSGAKAPVFHTWSGRLTAHLNAGDMDQALQMLTGRPGELGRRFDHVLRLVVHDPVRTAAVTDALVQVAPKLSNPVLLTLARHLPSRVRRAPVRVYFPKGGVTQAPSAKDERVVLSNDAIRPAVQAVETELLARFATKPPFHDAIIDARLADIIAPFNERTASPSAVSLPRGSIVPVRATKLARMFVHWCEPEKGGETTDVDLSVAFYDANWKYAGTCSYYALTFDVNGTRIATSAGDLRGAPFPDGASELVDLDRDAARAAHIRYAVMVVTSYSGMPFSKLERGFAGLMLRDDPSGTHFDARTVELKFALQGEKGVFAPLVFDLEKNCLHWVDAYSRNEFETNNVQNARGDLATLGREHIAYFGNASRATMLDVAQMQAAARCQRVFVRPSQLGATTQVFTRRGDESPYAFLQRLKRGEHDAFAEPSWQKPALAAFFYGDTTLPEGSESYVLFPQQVTGSISASDWVS